MSLLLGKSVAFLVASKNSASSSYVCKPYFTFPRYVRYFSASLSARQSLTKPILSDFLLKKHKFSPEAVSKVSSALTRLESVQNPDSVLTFLKNSGFSNAQLEKIFKYRPRLLSANVDRSIKPKIDTLREMGLSPDNAAQIITSNPAILHTNVDKRLVPALSVLKSMLGSDDEVADLLKRSGWFLSTDLSKNMVPNLEFLKSCGVPGDRIHRLLQTYPRFLLIKPELMRESVQRAEKMGFCRTSNMFIYAIRVLGSISGEAWEIKIRGLKSLGFSDDDLFAMFNKAPQLFAASVENIKRTKDVLLASGKFTMSSIVSNPMSLGCSVERRIEPRLRILKILEEKNLIKGWPTLGTLFSMSKERFADKFVNPYLDLIGESKWSRILSVKKE